MLYLIDSFSKEKVEKLKTLIEEQYKDAEAPKDICYVTVEDFYADMETYRLYEDEQGRTCKAEQDNGHNAREVLREFE